MFRSIYQLFVFFCLVAFCFIIGCSSLHAAAEITNFQDPTRPSVYADGSLEKELPPDFPSWNLTSTLISPRRSLAIINGHIFQKGQFIGNSEIVSIQPGEVCFRHGEDSFLLRVTNYIQKKHQSPIQETAPQELH